VIGDNDDCVVRALREATPQALQASGVPGVSVAVAHENAIWEGAFGLSDVRTRRGMTAFTLGRVGSISKLYTAVAVLQLVEDGLIELDAPLGRYLDVRVENPLGAREVTVRDLMLHRSGLTTDAGGCSHLPMAPLKRFVRAGFASSTLDEYGGRVRRWTAHVGERFQYSNFGVAALGYLVEVRNREALPYADYVRTRILEPLRMTRSFFPRDGAVPESIGARVSAGYSVYGRLSIATPHIEFAASPADGLLTTPGDHLALLLALNNRGRHGESSLLTEESVNEMLRPAIQCGPETYTGLLVRITRPGCRDESFGHWGAHPWGWWNASAAFPNLGLAVAVCANGWEMARYLEEEEADIATVLVELAAAARMREVQASPPPPRGWPWKISYVIGLVLAERTKAVLGIDRALPSEVVDGIVRETPAQPGWDPAGFRAGVRDMLAVAPDPERVSAFLESQDLKILRPELDLIHRELGGRGRFALRPELGSTLVAWDGPVAIEHYLTSGDSPATSTTLPDVDAAGSGSRETQRHPVEARPAGPTRSQPEEAPK
jgi:CubicO group peptidase (beta-lactamase class C family)